MSFDRPVIAVTVRVRQARGEPTLRTAADNGYLKGAEIAGGIPVTLSATLERETFRSVLGRSDGLILTGGQDVGPERYGETMAGAREVSPERDEMEFRATEIALERGIPILAICRGMQVLNVARGGSLYQDLATRTGSGLDHDRSGIHVSRAVHPIRVERTDLLEGVFPDGTFHTNSTHHQAIRELGEGLVAVARSPDDVVEAVEYRVPGDERWVAGVQWHPERMLEERTGTNRRIFERFGRAIAEHGRPR